MEKRSWKCLNMTVFTQKMLCFNLEVVEKTLGLEYYLYDWSEFSFPVENHYRLRLGPCQRKRRTILK